MKATIENNLVSIEIKEKGDIAKHCNTAYLKDLMDNNLENMDGGRLEVFLLNLVDMSFTNGFSRGKGLIARDMLKHAKEIINNVEDYVYPHRNRKKVKRYNPRIGSRALRC